MFGRSLFISDLHIDHSRPDITAGFFSFLDRNKHNCDALYILGDLFEVWVGDDAITNSELEVASKLREFSECGASLFIMHGNRDFLIGSEYAERCGATIIYDHHLINIGQEKLLLLHGDTLCTDDEDYQKFRTLVRTSSWQKDFLNKSIKERTEFAEKARDQSRQDTSSKSELIMDVNHQAVVELFHKHAVSKILHGHTHRPAVHDLEVARQASTPQAAQRVVLGDWDKKGWFAELTGNNVELHSFKLSSKSAPYTN